MPKITRRTLFTGTAGIVAATQFSRPAWAPPSLHGIWGSLFNKTIVENDAVPNMPTDDSRGCVGYCYRQTTMPGPQSRQRVMVFGSAGVGLIDNICFVDHLFGGSTGLTAQITVSDSTGANVLQVGMNLTNDLHWHQNIFTWDASIQGEAHVVRDGISTSPDWYARIINPDLPGPITTKWSRKTWIGAHGKVNNKVVSPFLGDLTGVAVFAGVGLVDVTDPSIIADFWDATNEEPVKNATRGVYLRSLDRWPQIWLDGPPSMFKKNFAGYPFTWDSVAQPFTVTAGTLAQSNPPDAWGFTGES